MDRVNSDNEGDRPARKRKAAIPLQPHPGDELPASISAAAECLVAVWLRASERATERVSPSQLRALTVISRHDGINLSGLAAELGAIPSSATRLCDRLVAAGLLLREPAPRNKREVRLYLSGEGKALLEHIAANRRADLAAVLTGMSQADRKALLDTLESFAAAATDPGAGWACNGG